MKPSSVLETMPASGSKSNIAAKSAKAIIDIIVLYLRFLSVALYCVRGRDCDMFYFVSVQVDEGNLNVTIRNKKVAAATNVATACVVNDDDNSWTDVNLDENREDLRTGNAA